MSFSIFQITLSKSFVWVTNISLILLLYIRRFILYFSSPTFYPGQYPWGFQYPPPTLTTCDPTNPASNYQEERFSFLYTYLPRFEPLTYRSVILIHLHLTMQAIIAKPRIFLVIISYWSQTPLGQNLNFFISARLLSGAWTFSNVDLNMATCANETEFYKKLDALKAASKGKESKTTLFISDDFYDNAKIWLGQDEGSLESVS